MAWADACRVVSLAATPIRTKKARSSSSVILLPSNSACTIQVSRSSPGLARRCGINSEATA